MSKFGLYSEGPKISIDEHLSKLDDSMKEIFQEIRTFVLSLGSNVIEEVRPHRVVYAKSFNFRTFLDIEPLSNTLAISVKMEPRSTPNTMNINSKEQLQDIKDMIQKAYARI
ncbi:MAG: hypothetical protein HZA83_00555 [Thaumarchaeota archaeon]|nr:hypothetical protein [Nitrososphaerota archaeon]